MPRHTLNLTDEWKILQQRVIAFMEQFKGVHKNSDDMLDFYLFMVKYGNNWTPNL